MFYVMFLQANKDVSLRTIQTNAKHNMTYSQEHDVKCKQSLPVYICPTKFHGAITVYITLPSKRYTLYCAYRYFGYLGSDIAMS